MPKLLGWGDPEKIGSLAYRGLQCGEGTHRVSMRCQASLGVRCAKVSVDTWGSHVSPMLHEGGSSRHGVLTMPERVRQTFDQRADVVLSACMRCGVRGVADVCSWVRGQDLKGGDIVVIQTPGRNGQDNPHLHCMATSGGWDQGARRWVPLDDVP